MKMNEIELSNLIWKFFKVKEIRNEKYVILFGNNKEGK